MNIYEHTWIYYTILNIWGVRVSAVKVKSLWLQMTERGRKHWLRDLDNEWEWGSTDIKTCFLIVGGRMKLFLPCIWNAVYIQKYSLTLSVSLFLLPLKVSTQPERACREEELRRINLTPLLSHSFSALNLLSEQHLKSLWTFWLQIYVINFSPYNDLWSVH